MVACSATALAQTAVTLPKGYENREGLRARHVPLFYLPARIQTGFGPKATGWTRVRQINSLRVRPDETCYLTAGFSIDMQIWLSSKGCNPKVPDAQFAKNHGTDLAVFMAKKTFKFAPFKKVASPAPFSIELKGDRPFLWQSASLVVDWATYASAIQVNTNFWLDATNLIPSGTRGRTTPYGVACRPTRFLNDAKGLEVGTDLWLEGYSQNIGDVVISWVGLSKTAIALGGGCSLYTPPAIFHVLPVLTTKSTGEARFFWGKVPAVLNGVRLYSQMAAFETNGGRRYSHGLEILFGDYTTIPPYLVAHRYGNALGITGFDPDKDDAQFGWEGTGLIFELR